jgi:non-ribosomal peptide synthetase component F
LRFSKELTEGLRNLAQREHTTLVMTMLTAYAALLSRWSETTDVTLAFVSAGRNRPEFNNTIGFFAFSLYLRLEVSFGDSFAELLHRVSREYYTALEHQDFGRNLLAWPEAEYTKTVGFNWHGRMRASGYRETDIYGAGSMPEDEVIRLKSYPFKKAAFDIEWDNDWDKHIDDMDGEPMAWLSESADGISGRILYLAGTVSACTMENFTRSFQLIAQAGRQNPQIRVGDLPCERTSSLGAA